MKCPNCDKEVSPEWAICPYCKYEPVKCPNCDSGWLPKDAKFCPSCGCELDHDSLYDDADDETISCPYCGSDDVTDDGTNYLQYKCNHCGRRWGGTDESDDTDEESDSEETLICPKCGSDDVTDDGSGYLQFKCHDCGILWGNRHIKCPECGSTDTFDDGTDAYPYKCKNCGHLWGEEENEDDDGEYDEKEKDDEFHILFPVAGIVLGETTIDEILEQQYLYDKIVYHDSNDALSDSYKEDGITTVYYNDVLFTKYSDDIYFTSIFMTKNMFPGWKLLGFDMENSYTEWMNLFSNRRYKICIDEYPHKEYDAIVEYWYFKAVFRAYSPNESIMFKLEFSHHKGECTKSTKNTLLTLQVFSSNSSRWEYYN